MAKFIEMNRKLARRYASGPRPPVGLFLGPPSHLCTFPHRQTTPIGAQYVIVDS
jgi:hypothetical protein